MFGIWYPELDRVGPFARVDPQVRYPEFRCSQMTQHHLARKDSRPQVSAYLYAGLANATAFSPTEVMPLTCWDKALMTLQRGIALSTAALAIARAVNSLK